MIQSKFFKVLSLVLIFAGIAACSDDKNDPVIPGESFQISADIATDNLPATGKSFFVRIVATGDWSISASDTWCELSKASGSGSASVMSKVTANALTSSRSTIITVKLGTVEKTITLTQQASSGTEQPGTEDPGGVTEYSYRIEIPKLKGGITNLFYTHTSQYNNKNYITYSAEYDCTKKHTRWVAYTFDNVNKQKNTSRTDDWGQDPNVPAAYRTYSSDYNSPYNRGHLVASADRYLTREANQQTFYYSNMSPQIISFNGGVWNTMEEKVRSWASNISSSDTLYVAKGGVIDGTIADGTLLEYTGNQVAVPRYYFMALLFLKGGQYKAMAFYIDQKNYSSSTISSYAISIDALEQKTGIDFFHNLPDAIETTVEATYNPSDWF